ncbi:hypothetical protein KAI04_04145 [Candidatus Pacearchaeota archaeon]|nr:hypothetical protein [Candidatus Pacearchaeota archaeon]
MEKTITTIAIYVEDHKTLESLCKKGESFRDKFRNILDEWMKIKNSNAS